MDWTANTEAPCRKGQSCLHFLRRLASFSICRMLLPVCGSKRPHVHSCVLGLPPPLKKRDIACLDKLVRKAGSVVGAVLDNQTSVTMNWLLSIIDNPNHSLHSAISRQRSSFSDRLLSLSCFTNRLRKSFLPHTIQLCKPHGESDKRCATYDALDLAL
ncbi:hypothetical protein D4764_17G0006380 [Takifugu flavidus]|uniref:Alkylated DNA repair protein AlkB homologue 8 N-terminal domain-containing protein n=1 Tax=Takifugu flavidus TaxID=433684 RepID=A0A5C6NW04_9TELE|nr:hypothetical protein D4764_17G0006380 [Takifugu flavidus]